MHITLEFKISWKDNSWLGLCCLLSVFLKAFQFTLHLHLWDHIFKQCSSVGNFIPLFAIYSFYCLIRESYLKVKTSFYDGFEQIALLNDGQDTKLSRKLFC